MRRIPRVRTFALAALLSASAVCRAYAGSPSMQEFTQIERGRYLSILSDCAGCHTVPGGKPFSGGRPIETPFGNIISPNVTPDLETGIGAWSDDQFDAAVRKGIGRTGAHIYPAMPYNAYTRMSRDDVMAIRAYLNSLEPVRQSRNANTLPFPFNIRSAMSVWNALYFTAGEFKPDPTKSAEWNRGKFIVEGPAHCGACHTPKTLLGGDRAEQYLQGANLQGWSAPDITNNRRTGLGSWTAEDVALYLKTGHNRAAAATGPMAEAVDCDLPEIIAGQYGSGRTCGSGRERDGGRRCDLPRPMLRLPRNRGQGRSPPVSRPCSVQDGAIKRSHDRYSNSAPRCTKCGHEGRADSARHAGLRLAARRSRDRCGAQLCQKQLGWCRCADRRRGCDACSVRHGVS